MMYGRSALVVFFLILLASLATAQRHVSKSNLRKTPSVPQSAKREGSAERFDGWRVLGPGGGGTMIGPTISPHDPSVVLEHCDMTGGYVTTDGGSSWRMFN